VAQLFSLGGIVLMRTFNRKVAIYVGLLVLAFDGFLCYIQYPVGFVRLLSYGVNIPGLIPIAALGSFAPPQSKFGWWVGYIGMFVLSAAFWAVIFGLIFRRKLPPNQSPEPTAVTPSVPHSRATDSGRRWLSFFR
jgi:hypothetical protein